MKIVSTTRSPVPVESPKPYLYDIEAARKALGGVGRTWLYEQIREGNLKPVKLGTRTMFAVEDVERLVIQLRAAA